MHWTEIVTIIIIGAYLLIMAIYLGHKMIKGEHLNEIGCPFRLNGKKIRKEYMKAQKKAKKCQ